MWLEGAQGSYMIGRHSLDARRYGVAIGAVLGEREEWLVSTEAPRQLQAIEPTQEKIAVHKEEWGAHTGGLDLPDAGFRGGRLPIPQSLLQTLQGRVGKYCGQRNFLSVHLFDLVEDPRD